MNSFDNGDKLILDAGDAARAQKDQIIHAETQILRVNRALNDAIAQGKRQDQALEEMMAWMNAKKSGQIDVAATIPVTSYAPSEVEANIQMTQLVPLTREDTWENYLGSVKWYADLECMDLTSDPYLLLLTQKERENFAKQVREDYYERKANCDAIDNGLAAFSGLVSGAIDVFLVKSPLESKLGEWTDEQADAFVKKVAQKIWDSDSPLRESIKKEAKEKHWSIGFRNQVLKEHGIPYNQNVKERPETLQQCIQYLEKKFGVNYDASSWSGLDISDLLTQELKKLGLSTDDSLKDLRSKLNNIDLSELSSADRKNVEKLKAISSMRSQNHHLRSLAHIPSLIGLLFSIIDQFTGKGTFISEGKWIRLAAVGKKNAIDEFELRGKDIPSKIVCAVLNWAGHCLSDYVGSNTSRTSGSLSRGMGLACPGVELFQFLSLTKFKITKDLANLVEKVYEEGYDRRFRTTTAIPVLLNDLLVRMVYSVKRYYYHHLPLTQCVPVDTEKMRQPELRRMLLTAHGVMCGCDLIDATTVFLSDGANLIAALHAALHLNFVGYVRLSQVGISEIRAKYRQEHINLEAITADTQKEWERLYKDAQQWLIA